MADDKTAPSAASSVSGVASGVPAALDDQTLARLASHLGSIGLGHGPLRIQRLTGGRANPTFRVAHGKHRLVLRTKAPAAATTETDAARALSRERRIMAALAVTLIPVPEIVHYCDDASILGAPFILMDHLEGRVFTDPTLPGVTPSARQALYGETARVLAALHDVDPDAIGLSDVGEREHYFGAQIEHWSAHYRRHANVPLPAMESLMNWLPDHVPDDGRMRIVHGGYGIDNLIFHPTEPRVLALVDWEHASLGHPYADLAQCALAWHLGRRSGGRLADHDLQALSIPDESAFVNAYLTHRQAEPVSHWDAYLAYAYFRRAALLQARMDGPASAAIVASLAEAGWQRAQAFDRTPLFRTGPGR